MKRKKREQAHQVKEVQEGVYFKPAEYGVSNAEAVSLMLKHRQVIQCLDDGVVSSSWQELQDLARGARHLMIIFLMDRPGAQTFATQLEWQMYEPKTEANKLFHFYQTHWQDLEYSIICVPWEHKQKIEEFAARLRMRLADGVPLLLDLEDGSVKPTFFPVQGSTVWTLENIEGAPVYSMQPGSLAVSLREEQFQIKEFQERMTEMLKKQGKL